MKKLGIAVISVALIFSAVIFIWIMNDGSKIAKSKQSLVASLAKNNAVSINGDMTDAEKTRALVGKQNYEASLQNVESSNSTVVKPRMRTLADAQKSRTDSFNDKTGPIKSVAKWVPYYNLSIQSSDSEQYLNQVVFFTGRVFRTYESNDAVCVDVSTDSQFNNTIVVKFDKNIVNGLLSNGDYITFWGEYNGLALFTDSLGGKYNVPIVTASIIE